jgi:hypothetical protein
MTEVRIPENLIRELEEIYQGLEKDYDAVARQLSFSCTHCPDNCCDSYFLHHTYAEWAYLWLGFRQLDSDTQQVILQRASTAVLACEKALMRQERPQVMCPLNEGGLCILYTHRLLVCRTHGVPASMTRPDGRKLTFPGCFRCQEIVDSLGGITKGVPTTERTPYLQRLAALEAALLKGDRQRHPKVGLTISQMLVNGPPVLRL